MSKFVKVFETADGGQVVLTRVISAGVPQISIKTVYANHYVGPTVVLWNVESQDSLFESFDQLYAESFRAEAKRRMHAHGVFETEGTDRLLPRSSRLGIASDIEKGHFDLGDLSQN
jgi:hypothetical protein